ncbi:MAG TPA: hypothetical protein VMS56_10960 [Thermoanaerobaculia bacterium]|nr:hypothetical protein [Thermoanaerobaculia bacterium]
MPRIVQNGGSAQRLRHHHDLRLAASFSRLHGRDASSALRVAAFAAARCGPSP